LRFEQQLHAYQKLHTDELAELWRTLNECKQAIASLSTHDGTNGPVVSASIYAEDTLPGEHEEEKGGE
jgi:hypothetical protein